MNQERMSTEQARATTNAEALLARCEWQIHQLKCFILGTNRRWAQIKIFRNKGLAPHQVAMLRATHIPALGSLAGLDAARVSPGKILQADPR